MDSDVDESDAALAARLADSAGRLLLDHRAALFAQHHDSQALKDAADALAQGWLAQALRSARPTDAVLSEEAVDDLARLDASRVWIIDPLDGTREYARAGRVDWAVHVALWEADRGLTAGAVAVPAEGLLLATVEVQPVVPRDEERPLKVVVSGSRTPVVIGPLSEVIPLEVTTWGSAGAKAARVITGEADLYLHDSALNEWDAAAPVAVAHAAGLVTVGLDGRPLEFNRRDTVTGGLVMGRAADVERVVIALAELGA